MLPLFLSFLLATHIPAANSQEPEWSTYPFYPPSLPIAVKSPYLNAWALQGDDLAQLSELWPKTPAVNTLGWNTDVRVDEVAYNLMGFPPHLRNFTNAIQTNVIYTPTRTSYILKAGPIDVNITLLSPIEAQNLTRLSMPFSYMYLTATSNDNNPHRVQFYSDVTGEWISGDTSLTGNYAVRTYSDYIFLQMSTSQNQRFQEIESRPQDATLCYCMKNHPGLSWEIGFSDDMRNSFGNGTGLLNSTDRTSHPLDNPWTSLGFSIDIGPVNPGSESETIVHAIGVVRDPAVQYALKNSQPEYRRSYYWSKYSGIEDIVGDVLDNFDSTLSNSIDFDNKLIADANGISSEYAGLVSLVTRQAMSAIEFTFLNDPDDIKAFLNNTGRIGSGQLNAVDIIYAAMPIYVYLNPNITGYLLSPILEYQLSLQGTNDTKDYAAIDIGGPFPNATGTLNDTPNEGIEQSANMIILSLIHAKTSGDGTLLSQYYDLLAKWANYLVDNVLSPESANQASSLSDGITSPNQTNLVLKGIIGIQAMSEISTLVSQDTHAAQFKNRASEYYSIWESLAITSDRIALTPAGNSGLIYNLYADKILGLNLVNESVYQLQTSFYGSQVSENTFGIPIDSTKSGATRSDWMLFAAAAATDPTIRNSMISQVHRYAMSNSTNFPFSIQYNPTLGSMLSGIDSPAQGAIFAPLALNVEKKLISTTPIISNGDGSKRAPTKLIVGSTIGAIALIAILAYCIFVYRRWRQNMFSNTHNRQEDHIRRRGNSSVRHVNSVFRRSRSSTTQRVEIVDPVTEAHIDHYRDIIPVPFTLPMPQVSDAPGINAKGLSSSVSRSPLILGSHAERDTSDQQEIHNNELLRELNHLRMENERLREENALQNLSPPSYGS